MDFKLCWSLAATCDLPSATGTFATYSFMVCPFWRSLMRIPRVCPRLFRDVRTTSTFESGCHRMCLLCSMPLRLWSLEYHFHNFYMEVHPISLIRLTFSHCECKVVNLTFNLKYKKVIVAFKLLYNPSTNCNCQLK